MLYYLFRCVNMGNNIEKIVNHQLCTGCGTCVALCPLSIIKMRKNENNMYEPFITGECNKCKTCTNVCPGKNLDIKRLRNSSYRDDKQKLIGPIIANYVGCSCDQKVRQKATSGGLISSLLIFALDQNIIDGVLVTKMSLKDPFEPESYIARSPEDIINACGSKYYPVPLNMNLGQILEEEGKFAVVGLPCHLHGIKKAQNEDSRLKEKIILTFGIFCSHNVNFRGTEFLIDYLNIDKEQIASFAFRTNGWPGCFKVNLKDGKEKFIPLPRYWPPIFGRFFFTPYRCTLCPDGLAELADISFGDAWLPEFADNTQGISILISRTSDGDQLVQKAIADGRIHLSKIGYEKVLESQKDQIYFKKKNIISRKNLLNYLGRDTPSFGETEFLEQNKWDKLTAIIPYMHIIVSKNKLGRFLLSKTPLFVLNIYGNTIIQKLYDKSYSELHFSNGTLFAPKIVIINSFSPNIGDLSIVESMTENLKIIFQSSNISVFATNPSITRNVLNNVEIYNSLGSRSSSKIYQLINFILFLRNYIYLYLKNKGINLFFLAKNKTKESLKVYSEADIIISCGGGYLNDNGGYSFLGCLFDIYLAVILKKPIMLFAQSIGPFRINILKIVARKVIDNVDVITLRDKISKEFLDDIQIKKPKIKVTADAALLLPIIKKDRVEKIFEDENIPLNKPLVTITVKPWHFPTSKKPEFKKKEYLESLKNLTKHVIKDYNCFVLFIPMDIDPISKSLNNNSIFRKIVKKVFKKLIKRVTKHYWSEKELLRDDLKDLMVLDEVALLNEGYQPSEIKSIINESKVHIATRMHSSIYAVSQNIPVLGIAYEPKMSSFLESLNQNEFIFLIDKLDSGKINSKFDLLWNNHEKISKEISLYVKELKNSALKNQDFVKDLLRNL